MQTPTSVGISATRTPSDGASDNTEESQGPQPWWHEGTGDSSREHGLTLVPGLCCGARDAALLRSPPATPRAPSPCPQGGQWALTGELGPAGAGVADAAQGEAPQAVIHQLPVAQPEPQQDPIDLILSWRLQGEGGKESEAAPIQGSLAPSGATRDVPVSPPRAGQRGRYLPADEHRRGGVGGDGEDGGSLLGGCGGEEGGEAPEMPRAEEEFPRTCPCCPCPRRC